MDPEANLWGARQTHIKRFNVTYPSSLDWRDMGFVTKVSVYYDVQSHLHISDKKNELCTGYIIHVYRFVEP